MSNITLEQLDQLMSHLQRPSINGFYNSKDYSHVKARVTSIQHVCNTLLEMLESTNHFGFEFKPQLKAIYNKGLEFTVKEEPISNINQWCNSNITLLTTMITCLKRRVMEGQVKSSSVDTTQHQHDSIVRALEQLSLTEPHIGMKAHL